MQETAKQHRADIGEMFSECQEVGYYSQKSIGTVCAHFGNTADFVGKSVRNRAFPFGIHADFQKLIVFSRAMLSGETMKDAAKTAGLGYIVARKMTTVLNAVSVAQGRPPYVPVNRRKDVTMEEFIKYQPHARQIKCNETGIVYRSIKAASREMDINASNISKQLKGMLRGAKGFTFSYIN